MAGERLGANHQAREYLIRMRAKIINFERRFSHTTITPSPDIKDKATPSLIDSNSSIEHKPDKGNKK